MKKKLFTALLALSLLFSLCSPAGALIGEASRAADTLNALGIVQGTDSGDYNLTGTATRAHAMAVILRMSGREKAAAQGGSHSRFTDLPAWAASSINYAYAQGWVTGTSATTFSPNQLITGNAFCAFLLRMLGYRDVNGDFTVSGAALFARRIGLISQDYGAGILTRGDLFQIAEDALTFPYKNSSETVISRLVSQGAVSRSTANALGLLDTQLTARQVYDRHATAVFQLNLYNEDAAQETQALSAYASGFFITSGGIAVTSYHTISGAASATVTLLTGETYPVVRVLYYDRDIDIAVLRISLRSVDGVMSSGFAHLDVAGTEEIRNGDTVYALGNPLGLGISLSQGIISDASRAVERYQLPCIMTTADISQGSSGGALLNAYGQVIGITSGAYAYGNSMYLAVPVDPAVSANLSGEGWALATIAAEQAKLDASTVDGGSGETR